ncbi:MAG: hypothetical protein ACF8PN_06265 [Phycisphaerales bacterium]
MSRNLATMFTMTTYGVWLRGDARGWVQNGQLMPPRPSMESVDRQQLRYSPFYFARADFSAVGNAIGESLIERMELTVYAMTVQSWHVHFVVGTTRRRAGDIVKCAKDSVRWRLRVDRPIWGAGHDKRFCYDEGAVASRIDYVERHNLAMKLERRPYSFLARYRFLDARIARSGGCS